MGGLHIRSGLAGCRKTFRASRGTESSLSRGPFLLLSLSRRSRTVGGRFDGGETRPGSRPSFTGHPPLCCGAALAEYEKYATLSGGSPGSTAFMGYAHARLGQRSQALRVLDQLGAAAKQKYVPALSFAMVYLGLGEKEQAFLWLEKAYDERTNSLAYLKVQAIWDPLRSDPRFADLVRRIGLPP